MSGPGDIGGEVSGEEAAWRDLIAHYDLQDDLSPEAVPWPERENLTVAEVNPADSGQASPVGPASADRTRIVRQAADPRSYFPPDEPEDEKYVPVPLPPPAKLDTLGKLAWAGLIGGPAYVLIVFLAGWTISGLAAFAATAAFITGFVILVLRLGDGSKRDDDDDGAVV